MERCRVSRIICFGEMLLRLAARPPALLGQEGTLDATFCGAEANVAVALAGFGHDADLVTLLPDNRLGRAARDAIRAFGVNLAGTPFTSGRMGLYFLSPGAMARPAEILYDRAHSAFADLSPDLFDWPALLNGADWLFVGGITAALGEGPLAALRSAMATARERGVRIVFDCNFRPSLWQGREDQAKRILRELSLAADVLLADPRVIGLMLDRTFADPDPATASQNAAQAMFALAPALTHVAATHREVSSSDNQRLTGLLASRAGVARTAPVALAAIVDRIGTGDAFAAGIVHGLARGMAPDRAVTFATGCSQWAHPVSGDFLRASEADIESILAGGGDVRR